MSDGSRERILLRRAQFVTAALSGLTSGVAACSKVNDVPRADPSNKPLPAVSASASSQPEAELPPGLPSLETPAGVSSIAKEELEKLAGKVRAVHEHLARAANAIPSCSIADEACKKIFREIADHLVQAEQGIQHFGPRCPGTSKDAKLVDARVDEHRTFAKDRLAKIRQRLASTLEAQGPAAAKTWTEVLNASVDANPQPCLKYACPEW
ncbi:MAG: hypothetical protein ACXVEF_29060 [Polyangiales bacterium]